MHKRKTEKQSLFPHVLDAATRFAALKVQKSNRKMSEMKTGNINGKMKTGVMPRMTSHQYRHQTQKFPHRKPKNSAYFRTLFVRSRRLGAQKVQKQISKKCRKWKLKTEMQITRYTTTHHISSITPAPELARTLSTAFLSAPASSSTRALSARRHWAAIISAVHPFCARANAPTCVPPLSRLSRPPICKQSSDRIQVNEISSSRDIQK